MQRLSSSVAQMPRQPLIGVSLPLIGVIVVGADDIEIARRAAQFRLARAGQHIPGLKLRGVQLRGELITGFALFIGNQMNKGIAMKKARPGIGQPDGVAARQGRAHQLALDIVGSRLAVVAEQSDRQAPAKKGDFIHRRIDRRAMIPGGEESGDALAKSGEARDKVV